MNLDKLPPHSDEAELGALACVLLDQEYPAKMVSLLHRSHFFDPRHQTLFSAIARLVRKTGKVDTLTLRQELKDKIELEAAGGEEYAIGLSDGAPSAANFPAYLEILGEKSSRRRLIQAAQQLCGRGHQAAARK